MIGKDDRRAVQVVVETHMQDDKRLIVFMDRAIKAVEAVEQEVANMGDRKVERLAELLKPRPAVENN